MEVILDCTEIGTMGKTVIEIVRRLTCQRGCHCQPRASEFSENNVES